MPRGINGGLTRPSGGSSTKNRFMKQEPSEITEGRTIWNSDGTDGPCLICAPPAQPMKAQSTCQCVHPDTGETGCWLFTGESHRTPGSGISPVFPDLAQLFQWCNHNGWQSEGYSRFVYEKSAVHARMTPTEHEKAQWSRMAQDAYSKDQNQAGHKFSYYASLRKGESIKLSSFDELQAEYRAWLVDGSFKPEQVLEEP